MFHSNPINKAAPATVEILRATAADIPAMKELIFTHGPNQWNHLPEDWVHRHIEGVAGGETLAVLAHDGRLLVGMATANIGDYYPQYEDQAGRTLPRGYIAEAVVHSGYAGRGIGSKLLEEAKELLRAKGISTIYIKRHADNEASGGMMRKAGFEKVDEFYDPEIRTSGSRRTVVARVRFPQSDNCKA